MNVYTVQSSIAVSAVRCGRCQETKPESNFRLPQNGKYCRPCEKQYKREHYEKNKAAIIAKTAAWRKANWHRYQEADKAYRAENRERLRAQKREYQKKNSKTRTAYSVEWRRQNLERQRQTEARYRERNREACNDRIKAWKKANRDKVVLYSLVRGQCERQAIPPWADIAAVRAIYEQAAAMRREGHDVHVDHVVPLRSQLVCGLHWEGNLHIVPRIENLRKCNYRWPDMP